jgi:hypothetical protein
MSATARGLGLALALLVLTGCSTVVPMQTASAVDRGRFRVGAQGSGAAFCGDVGGGVLGLTRCTDYPDGIPLPEIRVNTRYGLGRGFDVGGSVQAQGQLFAPERPFQLGLTLDVKGELLRVPTKGPTHILSVGLLGGGALAGRLGLPLWAQLEWGVPLLYGLQLEQWELVAGVNLSQRYLQSPGLSPSTTTVRTGFTLGLFKRAPAGFALQLGYLTDPARFSSGSIQLQVGVFFDVG